MRLIRDLARAVRQLRRAGPAAAWRRALHEGRRALARRLRPHPLLADRPPLSDLLGMSSPEEQAWLFGYGARRYGGVGEIVDLGCWFGSTTIALAQGLAANPRVADRRGRIHAYDRFVWEEWMEDWLAGTRLAGSVAPGESFLPHFAERIAPWRELVTVHRGDLVAVDWPDERPIELLFNDAGKSWALANAIQRAFYPALVAGVSLVVEQDFGHYFTPWVHLLHERLREHFEPVFAIPYSGSVVFRLVRPVPRELVAAPLDFDDFSSEQVDRAFAVSLGLVDPPMKPNVWAARVMWEVHQGRVGLASRLLAEAPRMGLRGLDLDKLPALIAAVGGSML